MMRSTKKGSCKTHESETAEQDHGDDCSLEVLVLDQLERFEAEVSPALPERRLVVPSEEREAFVAGVRTAVGGVLSQQHVIRACVNHVHLLDGVLVLQIFFQVCKHVHVNHCICEDTSHDHVLSIKVTILLN